MKTTATSQEASDRDAHDREDRKGVFAGRTLRESDRNEAGDGHERCRSAWERQRLVGECGGLLLVVALPRGASSWHRSCSWRRRPARSSAMISAPSEMRCRSMLTNCMTGNTMRERQRDRKRDDRAGADAEADEADRHDDHDRLPQRGRELADARGHGGRLIGHRASARCRSGRSAVISSMVRCMFRPSVRMSPPSRMAMARPIAGLPFTRNIGCGGSAKPRRTWAMSPSRIRRPFGGER